MLRRYLLTLLLLCAIQSILSAVLQEFVIRLLTPRANKAY